MSGHESVTGAWLHSLLEYVVYSWAWECNYKLTDQSVCERVTSSYNYSTCTAVVLITLSLNSNLLYLSIILSQS